ncbi:class I SAM-dependent methyltransferase [Microlunatus speluncae]|uniref:class I SAM-dependent methyltransferase n=1 Tax=Microlunatus speluncae TaxID=2594267 RepID=UPI00126668AC|nr:class I SAM-dependent methyltransferase [Microlunatus speluncae]
MNQQTVADQSAAEFDRGLKAKHRATWALGNYTAVAVDVIAALGPVLVSACRIGPDDRVLDIAAGSGNVAIPAALTGADVVASDLTPELLAAGERIAAEQGASLTWREADAEALPFADGEFDVVVSCVGTMFAPHHQATADELVRVCSSGGRIGLISWTPQGFIGQLFATMKPYAPPPPPGVQPPPLWGDEDHVRGLLGDRVGKLQLRRQELVVDRFGEPDAFRTFFTTNYGPTIATYRNIADDPERTAALDAALDDLAARFRSDDGTMRWEYLLVTAEKR